MMTKNNPDNHGSTPEDQGATQGDAQLRELFASLPVSRLEVDFGHRVLVRVHRRKIAIRATWTASVIVLMATGWHLSTGQLGMGQLGMGRLGMGQLGMGDGDLPQPPQVASVQPPHDSDQPPVDLTDEVELFATAYHGLSSPISGLETLENERQVLLDYIKSLEVSREKQ